MQIPAHPSKEIQNALPLAFHYTFHNDFPSRVADGDRDGCLMHIHTDILRSVHQGVLRRVEFLRISNLLQKGTLYNACRKAYIHFWASQAAEKRLFFVIPAF